LGMYVFYRGFGGPGKGRTAVVRETSLYRVPEHVGETLAEDPGGAAISTSPGFAEGEPVLIRSAADSWAYVESFDGRAGWVPAERLVPY
jgi:hypothetical protein